MDSPARRALLERLQERVARSRMGRAERLRRFPLATLRDSAEMRLYNLLFRLGGQVRREARTFFGERMSVLLPSGYGEVYVHGATVDADAEVRLNAWLIRELPEGATFFDVGACLGYYSLLGAHLVGPGGTVHGFEPSPPLLPLLRENLGGRPNVRLVESAVSDRSGALRLHVAPAPFLGTSSTRADWQPLSRVQAEVAAVSLDDHCAAAGVYPDVIKLDVEGAEDRALKGAERLLRERGPLLAVEVFTPLMDADRAALRFLLGLGYRAHAIGEDGRLSPLGDEREVERHLAGMQERYRRVQLSPNDFDNLVFKK